MYIHLHVLLTKYIYIYIASRLYFLKEFHFRVMKGHYELFFKKKLKLLANK